MRRLDTLDNAVFAYYGLIDADIAAVRARFTDWPR